MSDAAPAAPATGASVPREGLGRLFLRFLRFGALAWGGPVAQIAMIRQELVEEERWVTPAHFNRVLALYQVLPGPEAHELCVYFGMLARGRVGGILAGLGFMLPGFVLMFLLSWWYVRFGLQTSGAIALAFAALQAAVAALIVRAIHRIGGHVLTSRPAWMIAILAATAQLAGVHFAITLAAGGACCLLAHRREAYAAGFGALCAIALAAWFVASPAELLVAGASAPSGATQARSGWELFVSGLKAGLLTFGGAYTAIPFLQRDAVSQGAWMTDAQFLDGIALSGLLPAPLIIFSTFVGYLGGGSVGALAMTAGVFLPAFAFALVAHDPLERLVHRPRVAQALDGVTAAVVGLIAGTGISLLGASIDSVPTALVFAGALAALYAFKSKAAIPLVIAGAGIAGAVLGYAA